MRDLLSRGIGVHHGGLLPIVKEVCFALTICVALLIFGQGGRDPVRTRPSEGPLRNGNICHGQSK